MFNARELGTEKVKYHAVIYSLPYDLSFHKGADGVTRVQGITRGDDTAIHLFDISVEDGNAVLTENGVLIGEISYVMLPKYANKTHIGKRTQ